MCGTASVRLHARLISSCFAPFPAVMVDLRGPSVRQGPRTLGVHRRINRVASDRPNRRLDRGYCPRECIPFRNYIPFSTALPVEVDQYTRYTLAVASTPQLLYNQLVKNRSSRKQNDKITGWIVIEANGCRLTDQVWKQLKILTKKSINTSKLTHTHAHEQQTRGLTDLTYS